jgi:hypothetical protein
MRHWKTWLFMGFATGFGIAAGCAANQGTPGGTGGAGGDTTASSGSPTGTNSGTNAASGVGGGFIDGGSSGSGIDPDAACAKFSAAATQAPAAMLTVLDMSASMNKQSKWGTAQLAVVNAIDKDVFDTMSLGLVTFPSSIVDPPQCLCDYLMAPDLATCKALLGLGGTPGVSCGVSVLAEVALAPAGTDKSNAPMGVRHNIYQYLASHSPLSNSDDGSPIYDAMKVGYDTLKNYPIDKRIMVLITDGGFSCTSLSNPQRPGYFDGACNDWEYPTVVNQLITNARTDPSKPIFTFIVGVPGSNTNGGMVDGFAAAPYPMRLALSTYAVSGSPDTVDPTCDKNAVFMPNGTDPTVPCHIDLSNGGSFNADALATAISNIRGKALGCVYDLPTPPPGETIDPALVNVNVTLDGITLGIKKRSNPTDDCAIDGCWDYNAQNQVEILGKTCIDLGTATAAKVDILVGCATILK